MIRLVAFDMDGTVLTSDKTIPPRLCHEILRLIDKGIVCAPASGRFVKDLRETFAASANVMGFIGCNGNEVYLGHEQINQVCFEPDFMRSLVLRALDVPGTVPVICAPEANLVLDPAPGDVEMLDSLCGTYEVVHEIPLDRTVVKISLLSNRDIGAVRDAFVGVSPRITPVVTDRRACDLVLDGTTKATGLQKLAARLGISRSEIMAFGDQMNDLEMLRMAGAAVAMGNAVDEIKAVCDRVCATNDDYGVYEELQKL